MITSLQNQRIKDIVKLDNARERRKQNLFVIEGVRELTQAVAGGYDIRSLFVCDELLSIDGSVLLKKWGIPVEKVSAGVFKKIAYRDASDGIIALSGPKRLSPDAIRLSAHPFVIVLEAVEKPGNLGAILRTADAARVDAVIVCDPKTDIYNPNTIRSSIGCVFAQQIAACTSEEALQWLKQSGIRIHAAELTASECYDETDFTRPAAIVMGAEADGLTDFWLRNADRRIKIPMRGSVDSLNVSVSTAILTFEAMRQRRNSSRLPLP
ncbi:MAG: RNA methyltransferase [Bacteroidales bacterium]|jgi:TrmH family RNA methyltransferase|nr:RNA methyltransferase [Bacteroidales bacterium]